MILESLISDDTILTLDCAKATLRQGGRVEIDDEFYFENEVQSAIKLGFIRIVGSPPAEDDSKPEDVIRKFKNTYNTRLCFDCIKGSVDPGEFIEIPESMLDDNEISNALGLGMLEDPSGLTAKKPVGGGAPVNIDEVSLLDDDDEQESISLSEVNISEIATSMLIKSIVKTYEVMPLTFDDNVLTIAAATENPESTIQDLKFMLNCEIRSVLASKDDIMAAIEQHYGTEEALAALDLDEEEETEEELGGHPIGVSGVDTVALEEEDDFLEDVFGPEEASVPEELPEDVPATRPVPEVAPKAKSISRVGEGDIDDDGDGDEENTLFAPSKVYDPEKAPAPKSKDKVESSEKTDNEDDNDFMNLFGDDGG